MQPQYSVEIKKRRADLDALRALAIIVVLGYHLESPYLKNGFLGVDIFFVLSGYLTTHMMMGTKNGFCSELSSFYKRRANRLLPAFLLMLLTFGALIWILVPLKIVDFAQKAFWSLSFSSNIYYYFNSGYFDSSSQLNFLLHTWSLSLEIQYYIFFPILILLLRKKKYEYPKLLTITLLLLFCLSLVGTFALGDSNENATFYFLPLRLWEFISGSFALIFHQHIKKVLPLLLRQFIAACCWIVLIAVIVLKTPTIETTWQIRALALVSVFTVFGIILMDVDCKVFSLKIIKLVARYSYSLYLWHWPLIVLFIYIGIKNSIATSIFTLLLCFTFASLSFRFIEFKSYMGNKKPLTWIALTLLFMMLIIPIKFPETMFSQTQRRDYQMLHHYKAEITPSQYGFLSTHLQYYEPFDSLRIERQSKISNSRPNYLLIGDCHAGMFSYSLKRLALQKGINLVVISMDETFPVRNSTGKYAGPVDQMSYIFEKFIPSNHEKIDKVILMADYSGYTAKELLNYFNRNHTYFNNLKIPIVYLGQTKKYRIEYPVASSQSQRWKIPLSNYEMSAPHQVNKFIINLNKVNYIDLLNIPTNKLQQSNEHFMYDTNHYSIYGTESILSVIAAKIFN